MAANMKDILKSAFVGAAALTLVATPMASAPSNVFAQTARVEQTSNAVTPYRQARRDAIAQSGGRIVIFYGSGIRAAGAAATALSRAGYPAIAVSGGPENQAEVFVNRGIVGGKFSETDMLSGSLGATAMDAYDQRVGHPRRQADIEDHPRDVCVGTT